MKVVVNLEAELLCPFQLFFDLAEQLPCDSQKIKNGIFAPICELSTTNDWINLESLGNPVALKADICKNIFREILNAQDLHSLEINFLMREHTLTIDNLYALISMAGLLENLDIYFYLDPQIKNIVEENVKSLLKFPNVSMQYIDTGSETIPEGISKTAKELTAKRNDSLQVAGFNLNHSHPLAYVGYAWMCLKSGAYEIGCRILQKRLASETPASVAREQLFMHLQLIRFLSHQYQVVTNEIFPEQFHYLDKKDVDDIYFIKAYCATLSRNITVAETYFKKCEVSEDLQLSGESTLYQLNIFALFLVLKGELDQAFSLEMRIKEYIEKNSIEVAGLKYVNFINIARLYKKFRCYDQAHTYYENAYREIRGAYTPSDYIYYHINMANLYEAESRNHEALFCWVNAAIYWLSCDNQYALAWRPRLILCQEKINDILKPLEIDKVNVFLYEKIIKLLSAASIDISGQRNRMFDFVLDKGFKKSACYVKDNLIIYTSDKSPVENSNRRSELGIRLARLVSNVIGETINIADGHSVIIVDSRRGCTVPRSDKSAWTLALLSGCHVCYRNNIEVHEDDWDLKKILASARFSLTNAISSLQQAKNGLFVRYKRSFLNKFLYDQHEIDLVKALSNSFLPALDTIKKEQALFSLIEKNIIDFAVPE